MLNVHLSENNAQTTRGVTTNWQCSLHHLQPISIFQFRKMHRDFKPWTKSLTIILPVRSETRPIDEEFVHDWNKIQTYVFSFTQQCRQKYLAIPVSIFLSILEKITTCTFTQSLQWFTYLIILYGNLSSCSQHELHSAEKVFVIFWDWPPVAFLLCAATLWWLWSAVIVWSWQVPCCFVLTTIILLQIPAVV